MRARTRRALVIGGNGFIGSHVVDRLVALGWEVSVLDRYERSYGQPPGNVSSFQGDYGHPLLLRKALIDVDVVFHLAWSTIHESSTNDPAADVESNLVPSIRLIENIRQVGRARIVFLSSAGTVYGIPHSLPIEESHPTNPICGYGITKLAVEKYLQMFRSLDELDYAIIRPTVPYGPRQNPLKRQGAVAVFLYRVGNRLPVSVWGDGNTARDFFYISDLVEAIVAAGERPLGNQRIFNIGGGQEVTLSELLDRVAQIVGVEPVLEHLPARPFDVPRIFVDTSLARSVLGWSPETALETGLERTWTWMRGLAAPAMKGRLPSHRALP